MQKRACNIGTNTGPSSFNLSKSTAESWKCKKGSRSLLHIKFLDRLCLALPDTTITKETREESIWDQYFSWSRCSVGIKLATASLTDQQWSLELIKSWEEDYLYGPQWCSLRILFRTRQRGLLVTLSICTCQHLRFSLALKSLRNLSSI